MLQIPRTARVFSLPDVTLSSIQCPTPTGWSTWNVRFALDLGFMVQAAPPTGRTMRIERAFPVPDGKNTMKFWRRLIQSQLGSRSTRTLVYRGMALYSRLSLPLTVENSRNWALLRGRWEGTERRSRPVQGRSPAKTTAHMRKGAQTGVPLGSGLEEPQGPPCCGAVHRRRDGRAA